MRDVSVNHSGDVGDVSVGHSSDIVDVFISHSSQLADVPLGYYGKIGLRCLKLNLSHRETESMLFTL